MLLPLNQKSRTGEIEATVMADMMCDMV